MREFITVRRITFSSLFKLTFVGTYTACLAFFVIWIPIAIVQNIPAIKIGGMEVPLPESIGWILISLFLVLPLICFLNALGMAFFQWIGLWCYSKWSPITISYYALPDNKSENRSAFT